MADLPTLDFSKFTEGSHQDQVKLGRQLVDSFRNHGFVKLVNHGFPDETITTMLDFVCSLFKSETSAHPSLMRITSG